LLALLTPLNVHAKCIEGDCVNGKGKFTWTTGEVYEGDFLKSERTGKGKFTWASGNVYEGDWFKDEQVGKGKFTWAGGEFYEGEFLKNERTGNGTFSWTSGDSYEGDWLNGELTGNRKYMFSNGDLYEGDYLTDKKSAKHKIVLTDGRVRKGLWRDGEFVETKLDRKKAEKGRIAQIAQYKRIFNACLSDKSSDLDMLIDGIEKGVKTICEAVTKDPSWLEKMKYDYLTFVKVAFFTLLLKLLEPI